MPIVLESGQRLTQAHEGQYVRFDGLKKRLDNYSPRKADCHRLHRVWNDGINVKKYGVPQFIRPSFIPTCKLRQRVQVFTVDEFEKLPE